MQKFSIEKKQTKFNISITNKVFTRYKGYKWHIFFYYLTGWGCFFSESLLFSVTIGLDQLNKNASGLAVSTVFRQEFMIKVSGTVVD